MEINKFILILVLLSFVLILGVVESFEYHEKELESEEGLQGMYDRWRDHHNVKEKSSERFNVFKTNVERVHNKNQLNRPYKLKLNEFAAMTNHEFRNTYAGSKISHYRALRGARNSNLSFMYDNVDNLPLSVDWREHNAVTPAKAQGACGNTFFFY